MPQSAIELSAGATKALSGVSWRSCRGGSCWTRTFTPRSRAITVRYEGSRLFRSEVTPLRVAQRASLPRLHSDLS